MLLYVFVKRSRLVPKMIKDMMFRFVAGGLVVSVFATLGDIFRPKSFAGLFGAAPSIALATLALTISKDGKGYASTEARSMLAGAVAFLAYATAAHWVLFRYKPSTTLVAASCLIIWFGVAFSLWFVWLR